MQKTIRMHQDLIAVGKVYGFNDEEKRSCMVSSNIVVHRQGLQVPH